VTLFALCILLLPLLLILLDGRVGVEGLLDGGENAEFTGLGIEGSEEEFLGDCDALINRVALPAREGG
jgi:hypothetical protein